MQSVIPISGIYKLTHIPTQKYYIGSSVNIYVRFYVHLSQMKSNKTSKDLFVLWNGNKEEWTVDVLEEVAPNDLATVEKQYLIQHMKNPNCLNTRLHCAKGNRGKARALKARHKNVFSMLGKNTSDNLIRRSDNVVLVAPDGTRYENVISINEFAKTHNLHQSSLTMLVNKKIDTVDGWILENGALPSIGVIEKYWTPERIKQYYDEYIVVGPDNEEYVVYNLLKFEQDRKVTIINDTRKYGVKLHTSGLNSLGQGYRFKNTPTFTVTLNGQTYTNIISLTKFANTMNISHAHFRDILSGKTMKNRRKLHVVKVA